MDGTPRPAAKERLLEAAVAVIGESGWAAATSRVVADRAEVNNALVHYYFGSIDALRRAAVEYALERELEAPARAILEAETVLDGMVEAVAALAGSGTDSMTKRLMVEATMVGMRDEPLREYSVGQIRAFRGLLQDRLAADLDRGLLRAGADPAALAATFTALLDGLLLHVMLDPEFAAVEAVTGLLATLRPPNEPKSE